MFPKQCFKSIHLASLHGQHQLNVRVVRRGQGSGKATYRRALRRFFAELAALVVGRAFFAAPDFAEERLTPEALTFRRGEIFFPVAAERPAPELLPDDLLAVLGFSFFMTWYFTLLASCP